MIANFGYSGFSYVGTWFFFLFVCVCLGVYDCDIKGTGTSTPLGEAQGKELQPLGTLDFFCKYFAFSGLSIYKGVGV